MSNVNFNELLDACAHFGHLKRKWNPNMAPYIFMEKNGIHIIDLHKTVAKIEEAGSAIKHIARSGNRIMFVATKKQAKEALVEYVGNVGMPYVTERWPGGMLTNFATIRKAVKKMSAIDTLMAGTQWKNIAKRERLQIQRERVKLEKNLGSIADMNRLPSALFVVDILKEHIAVAEARKLKIPVFAIVDTNSDPTLVDFAIPANDDASKVISLIVKSMCDYIQEGLNEQMLSNDKKEEEEDDSFDERDDQRKMEIEDDKPARIGGRRRRIGEGEEEKRGDGRPPRRPAFRKK
ncbi:MAG: 30S ribosomal protein S2 [Lentimicrobiaceae bacterium]|nr:30S ribosomal protein S2 [Lentimicrobiaceae bacterium]